MVVSPHVQSPRTRRQSLRAPALQACTLLDKFESVSPASSPCSDEDRSKPPLCATIAAVSAAKCRKEHPHSPTAAPATAANEATQGCDRQTLRELHQEAELRVLAPESTSPHTRSPRDRAHTAVTANLESPAARPDGTETPDKAKLQGMAQAACMMQLASPSRYQRSRLPEPGAQPAMTRSSASPAKSRTAMADVLCSPPRPQRQPGTPLRTQLPMSPPPSRTPLQRAGADAAITPRRGVPPPSGPTAASPGGIRTPNMRRVAAGVVPAISPAHSEDARQLMFLSTHPRVSFEAEPREPPTPLSGLRPAPKSAPAKTAGTQYISARNRAAAMVRWHKHKALGQPAIAAARAEAAALAGPDCSTCGHGIRAAAPLVPGGRSGGRKRKTGAAAGFHETMQAVTTAPSGILVPIEEEQQQQQPLPTPGAVPLSGPQEPQSGATATPAPVDCCPAGDMDGPAAPSPIDAGAHDGEDDDETFEPKNAKKRRRSSAEATPTAAAGAAASRSAAEASRASKMRRGAPPGPHLPRDPDEEQLQGDFTASETVWIDVPGRPPFPLQRLSGAQHGLPGLALRQVQCAIVPHTDRTSAFYLAMVRAAQQVGGLVRSATRPEMALLTGSGALAKGACRASLGTFPAVCRGLWRLGVDDATLDAVMAHDSRRGAPPRRYSAAAAANPTEPAALPPSPMDCNNTASPLQSQEEAAQSPPEAGRRAARSTGTRRPKPSPAPWASPAGGSAGSADTAMTTQQGAAAFGWHVTPAPTQTAAPVPLGGGGGAALLSGSRRSRRARRPSVNMQSSLEQEALLSDGGTPSHSQEKRRRSDAGSAHSGGPSQDEPPSSAAVAVSQQEPRPAEALPAATRAALATLRIDSAWLPLLQRPPSKEMMEAATRIWAKQQHEQQVLEAAADGATPRRRHAQESLAVQPAAPVAAH